MSDALPDFDPYTMDDVPSETPVLGELDAPRE